MINPIPHLQSDLSRLLIPQKDFFYHTSIGDNLQRVKSVVYNDKPVQKSGNSLKEAKNLIELADSAYKSGNYQAASTLTNNAVLLLTPLALYKFKTGASGITVSALNPVTSAAYSNELKNLFFKFSQEDIIKYGRSPINSKGNVNLVV